MRKKGSGQLNLRLNPALVANLECDAKRFGLKGKNVAAQEIISLYYAHWVVLQQRLKDVQAEELKNTT